MKTMLNLSVMIALFIQSIGFQPTSASLVTQSAEQSSWNLAAFIQWIFSNGKDKENTSFSSLPLSFIPNQGQTDPDVVFQSYGLQGALFFKNSGILINIPFREEKKNPHDKDNKDKLPLQERLPFVTHLSFLNANPYASITPDNSLQGSANFVHGNDPTLWINSLETYAQITYESLYPGIDLTFEGTTGELKGTYIVAPNANPSAIRWTYDGAEKVDLDKDGSLLISLPNAKGKKVTFTEKAPIAWQNIGFIHLDVSVEFSLLSDGTLGFYFPDGYNPDLPLLIDPTISYGTLIGDNGTIDAAYDIVVDSTGNAIITGYSFCNPYPLVSPIQGDMNVADVILTKVNANGSDLLFSTCLGGTYDEYGYGVTLDSSGNIIVVGETASSDFPVLNGITTFGGGNCEANLPCSDMFITQINPTGSQILYSTLLGGYDKDVALDVITDASDKIRVAGYSRSYDFSIINGFDDTFGGGVCDGWPCPDGILVVLDPTQSGAASLLYSSFFGGSGDDRLFSLPNSSSAILLAAGTSNSIDLPTLNAYQPANAGGLDATILQVDHPYQSRDRCYPHHILAAAGMISPQVSNRIMAGICSCPVIRTPAISQSSTLSNLLLAEDHAGASHVTISSSPNSTQHPVNCSPAPTWVAAMMTWRSTRASTPMGGST